MDIFEDLTTGLQGMNIVVDNSVIEKCSELCITYNIPPEDFIDQWFAYTASHLHGAPPTLDALDKMERKEFKQPRKIPPINIKVVPEDERIAPSSQPLEPITADAPSQAFLERKNAHSVLLEFGATLDAFKTKTHGLAVKVLNEEIAGSRYMHETCVAQNYALNAMTNYVVRGIFNSSNATKTDRKLGDFLGEMVVCGRVYTAKPGRVDAQAVCLEGTLESYGGEEVKLSLKNVPNFVLFNGQSVVLKGNNTKRLFVVEEILTESSWPPLQTPPTLAENLHVIAAAGPFTMADNILYEPLHELLKYIVEFKPSVVILMGPFMPQNHKVLADMNESYETFFEKIVDGIMEKLQGLGARVVLVPSTEDVHGSAVFPTRPFDLRKRRENLILAPNPFLVDIGGFLIGGSTLDVLFQLAKNEFYMGNMVNSDRFSRLVSHVLNQRSFYPIYPPEKDTFVDYHLLERYCMLESKPHLLLLPTIFKHFVKVVNGTIVVNSEKIIKGQSPGSFAKIEVRPGGSAISESVTCQIIRI